MIVTSWVWLENGSQKCQLPFGQGSSNPEHISEVLPLPVQDIGVHAFPSWVTSAVRMVSVNASDLGSFLEDFLISGTFSGKEGHVYQTV